MLSSISSLLHRVPTKDRAGVIYADAAIRRTRSSTSGREAYDTYLTNVGAARDASFHERQQYGLAIKARLRQQEVN